MGFELIALFELAALWGCFAAWAGSRDWVRLQRWHRAWADVAKLCAGADDAPPCPDGFEPRRLRLSLRQGEKRKDVSVVATLDLSDLVPEELMLTRHAVQGEARALLYGRDTETGDARFDRVFVVNGPPEPATVLLARREARAALLGELSDVRFKLRDGVATIRSSPEDLGLPAEGALAALTRLARLLPALTTTRDDDATLLGVALTDRSARMRRRARAAMPESARRRFGAVVDELPDAAPDRMALLRAILEKEPAHGALWALAVHADLDPTTRAWVAARAAMAPRAQARPTHLAAPSLLNA